MGLEVDHSELQLLLFGFEAEERGPMERVAANLGLLLVNVDRVEDALSLVITQHFMAVLASDHFAHAQGGALAAFVKGAEGQRTLPLVILADRDQDLAKLMRPFTGHATDVLWRPLLPEILEPKLRLLRDNYEAHARADRQESVVVEESEDQFRIMADCSPVLLWIAGVDARCYFFNRPWLEFTGRTLEQEFGYGWAEGVHAEDFQRCMDTFLEAFHARRSFQMEYRLRRADGQYRWVFDTGTPRFLKNHIFAGYVGSCVDITDRILAEEERESLLVSERGARAEAERLNRLKDEFLATMSHELRTPLNAIAGWSSLLNDKQIGPEDYQQAFEAIDRNAKIQQKLINDLLDVSHIVTGKLHVDVTPVDIEPIIREAIASVGLSAHAKNIRLSLVTDPSTGPVAGDPARLQQIVWNLLSNAIKFTPRGGSVEIRLIRVNSTAEIWVTDTGEGIDADFLPYVFDRFRQADASLTRRHGGLGLGLAIVRHLVELHGGSIAVQSRGRGLGAIFVVRLPLMAVRIDRGLRKSAEVSSIQEDMILEPATLARPVLNQLKILVVDDQADVLLLVGFILKRHGATVATAGSVREAMSAFAADRPDILLSDIGMPEENGYDLIRQIRALSVDQGGEVPAVALTAHVRDEDRSAALELGFQEHLPKPIEVDELVSTIAKLVGRGDRGLGKA